MMTRLVFLACKRDEISSYLIADESGGIVARGVLTPEASAPASQMRTVLVVPGSDVLARWIELPACKPVQAVAAATLLLKDEIAVPRDRPHLALGAAEEDGLRLVCIVDRARMQSFLDRAAELGVSADAVVPDHLMLPVPEDETVHIVAMGDALAVRGRRLAFSAQADLLPLLLRERPQRQIERSADAEKLFAAAARRPPIDLLQQTFARSDGPSPWRAVRRAGVLAAALLLSPLVFWSADIARYEFAARALEARAEADARTVASAGLAGDPILQLKGRLAELRASDSFLRSTAALFDAVAKIEGAELESLSYLQEGAIRATLIHSNASDVTDLARSLEQSGLILDEDAAKEESGRISTSISLRPRP